ncbi:uncharacterized protein [Macrobrachium rosenbergii]|uniref:uncharacterized protein isoform X1 n=1 Tax=Macrobrachium rosenbergii TaxID=79674 RepID=UPI0034D623A4
MNECDLIKVLKELKVYAQSWNKVTLKDFACQTDFPEPDNNNSVPFFYCCQFSSSGDAETQCDIPLSQGLCKSCAKSLSVENAATQCNLFKKVKDAPNSVPKRIKKYGRTIKHEKDEEFLSLGVPFIPRHSEVTKGKESTITLDLGDQQDICVSIEEEFNTYQTDLKTSFLKNDEVNVHSKQHDSNSKSKETTTYNGLEDCDDHHTLEPMDDDNHEETEVPEKYGLPEILEDEKLFWAEMKKKSKRIKLSFKGKGKKNGSLKKNDTSEVHSPDAKGLIKEERSKDSKDSDWITDDEEDEDLPEDFTIAFKDEWKKKRVPAHTHEKNYVCDVCNKPYSKSHYLRDHIVRDHSDHDKAKEYPFRCRHCKRVYNGQRQLEYHQSLHNGPCEICGMMFGCSGLFWNHRKNHDAVCNICNKSFSSLNSLWTHKKMKHGRMKYFCNVCDKGFIYKSLLKIHNEKAHAWRTDGKHSSNKGVKDPVKDLTCEECSYIAKNEQSLKVHQGMAHRRKQKKTADKIYSCTVCDAKLTSKSILKKHAVKCLAAFPTNKCSVCTRVFSTEKKLESHRRKIHGLVNDEEETQELHIISGDQEVYPCNICESSFDTSFTLQEHMLSIHSIPKKINVVADNHIVYECAYCNSSFESTSSLETHTLSVHSVSHTVSREIAQVTSESLHVTSAVEEYPVMEISLSNRETGSPESRIISEAFEIPVETSVSNFDTSTAVSLPASAIPADVSTVEIDGVKYHVIRNAQ